MRIAAIVCFGGAVCFAYLATWYDSVYLLMICGVVFSTGAFLLFLENVKSFPNAVNIILLMVLPILCVLAYAAYLDLTDDDDWNIINGTQERVTKGAVQKLDYFMFEQFKKLPCDEMEEFFEGYVTPKWEYAYIEKCDR